MKNIAIIGANKEGLKLLPLLLNDKKSRIRLIADPNKDAMLFKLKELGYRISEKLGIKVTTDISEVKRVEGLDIIINALQDQATEKFLESPEFRDVEKLGPLSTRLIFGVRTSVHKTGDRAAEQTALLGSLHEIVDAIRLTIDRKELLSVILKLATESIGAERGSIMLISDEGMLKVEIAKGMDEEVIRKIRIPLGEGISGKVAKEGKPLLISGKARSEEYVRPMDRNDVKSSMCVPLTVKGTVIGTINVSSSESSHLFTKEDLNFLTNLASFAAEVIHRSNEYEKLRIEAAKFTFWKEVDGIMSSILPLDRRLNSVAKKLVEIVPGLTCFIYVYDEDRSRLSLAAASIRDTKTLALSLKAGEGIEGSTLDVVKDIFLVDRAESGSVKRAYITLPMVSHGQIVGALNGQYVSTQGLSVYHESFLKEIRTLIADSVYKHKMAERDKLSARKMFAVDEAGLEMISMKDVKRLSTIISATPAAILGAEGSLLRLKHSGLKQFVTASSFGIEDKSVMEYFIPIEKETVLEVLRKKETVIREFSEEASPYIRSVISRPLEINGSIAGIITLFNKTCDGAVYPCGFSKSDSEILARFCVYAEKALSNAVPSPHEEVRDKPETLPPLIRFERRVEQELNRVRRFDKGLVLATIRIAGFKEIPSENKAEFEKRLIDLLRKRTRSFDVIVRLNEETFGLLFLDTDDRNMRSLEAITEAIVKDDFFKRAAAQGKLEILYGYASFPKDGDSFAELFSKASTREKLNIETAYNPRLNL